MKSLRITGSAQAARAAPQVVGVALEELHVGQHRQAGRAVLRVARGDRGRVEVLAQHALARAGLLDLGDDGGVAARHLRAHRRGEAARRGLAARELLQVGRAALRAGGGDLLALDLDDALQDVRHCGFNFCVTATNCSSLACAAPDATASRARLTPSADRAGHAGAVQRGAGVEQHDVAHRAVLVGQRAPDAAPPTPAGWPRAARASRTPAGRSRSGCTTYSRTSPSFSSPTSVSPRQRHLVHAVRARRPPSRARSPGAAARAPGCRPGRDGTRPSGCWARRPGWSAGPRMLKIVRTPSSLRTGAACFIDAWWLGANMKPMPVSSRQAATSSGDRLMCAPSASITSALPDVRRHAAPAVLGHARAGGGGDEHRRGRDVEGVRAVAAGADDVDQVRAVDAPAPASRTRASPGRGGDLADRLLLHAQADRDAPRSSPATSRRS